MADTLPHPQPRAFKRRSHGEAQWLNLAQAAVQLNMSASSLRRRLCYPHWIEGCHYRWIQKGLRPVIQVNLTEAQEIIRLKGW